MMRTKTLLLVVTITLSLLLLIATSCSLSNRTVIDELEVEYLNNPVGMDIRKPRFSWKIVSEERDVMQVAYRIIVSESEKKMGDEGTTVWDSGIINSNRNVNVEYEGKTLESNKNYYWKVIVWFDSEKSLHSKIARFTTGILDGNEWQAKWITAEDEIVHESPYLRKEFEVDHPTTTRWETMFWTRE